MNASVAALISIMLCSTSYMLIDARQSAYEGAAQAMTNIALTLEHDLGQTIDSLDLSLRALAAAATRPELPSLNTEMRHALLFGSTASTEHLEDLLVTDETGKVIYDSASTVPRPINASDRPYFQAHLQQPDAGLIISQPQRRRTTGEWTLILSRRVNHPDGSFAGLAISVLSLKRLSGIFAKLDLGDYGIVSLFNRERRLVTRHPYSDSFVGRDLSSSQVFASLEQAPSGTYEARSSVDGVNRLTAYRWIGTHTLGITVGLSIEEVYADWTLKAAGIGFAMLLLAAIAAGLTWTTRRELGRRLLAEQAARRSEHEHAAALARLNALFHNSADVLFVAKVEPGGFVLEAANPAAERLAGQSAAAMVGQDPAAVLHPVVARAVLARWRQCAAGRAPLRYSHAVALSGGAHAWDVFTAPVLDEAGRVRRLIGSARDVTARNRDAAELKRLNEDLEGRVRDEVAAREAAQRRAAQAERMQILGQLAGGIAHDFNNVLQAVRGGAALIERKPGDLAAVRRLARLSIDATARGAAITRRLLAYSRQDELRAEAVDTAALLDGLHEILVHTLGVAISVRAQFDPALPPILIDKGQLETVLLNLATNARDAMPDGGVLTLAAVSERAGPGHSADLAPGRYLRFTVTDTGAGMDAATLARVAEPFFTTKPVGKGTGLGLSMAKGFAEQSGGGFAIASQPGRGTAVTLWLPQASPDQASPDQASPRAGQDDADADTDQHGAGPSASQARPGQARPAGPRVLLVDDDAFVREVMAEELSADYAVLAAASGAEALALLAAGERVDAVVTDLSMPGMDGMALIRAVHARRPGLPALLLTGYAGDAAALAQGGAFTLLRKPATLGQVSQHLNNMLAGVGASA